MRGDCEDGNCFQTGSAQWNVAQFGRAPEYARKVAGSSPAVPM